MPEQLQFRSIHPDDIPALHAIMSHPQVAESGLHLYTTEYSDTEDNFRTSKPGVHRLVGLLNGEVVVYGLLRQMQRARLTHTGEPGVYVHPDYREQGVGSQMMEKLLDLADNWLNLWRLNLQTFTHNDAANHLAQKFGFELEGVKRKMAFGNGRFLDTNVYARLRTTSDERETRNDQPPIHHSSLIPPHSTHLTIRPAHPDDADDLSALWQHPLVCATTLQMPSQEIWHARKRMESAPPAGMHRLVAEDNGRTIGIITIWQKQNPRLRHSASLGMMVHPDYWNQGIGSRLMEAILDIADNWLDLKRVELEVNTDNPAAVHLYQKFGFEIEGTHRFHAYGNGRWPDSYFMGRVR